MATGGYTGEFGPEGRLAILHEKELVLNKHDTANMLEAVDIVRQLNYGLNSSVAAFGISRVSATTPNSNKGELQQNVTIEASFPGVSDHIEIEQAFNNLINTAAQYVNEKKL